MEIINIKKKRNLYKYKVYVQMKIAIIKMNFKSVNYIRLKFNGSNMNERECLKNFQSYPRSSNSSSSYDKCSTASLACIRLSFNARS